MVAMEKKKTKKDEKNNNNLHLARTPMGVQTHVIFHVSLIIITKVGCSSLAQITMGL
jgi:hypothetical protein